MDLIPEEHPIMQWMLRFLVVYSFSEPSERSQKAQEFATSIANREQRLIAALEEIEAHHVEINGKAGRDESHSHTLKIARSALAKHRS